MDLCFLYTYSIHVCAHGGSTRDAGRPEEGLGFPAARRLGGLGLEGDDPRLLWVAPNGGALDIYI